MSTAGNRLDVQGYGSIGQTIGNALCAAIETYNNTGLSKIKIPKYDGPTRSFDILLFNSKVRFDFLKRMEEIMSRTRLFWIGYSS